MYMIETKELIKKFDDTIAVNGVNLKINEGDIFGLLGPNGAGKSTTINMICDLITPTSGKILIEGKNIDTMKKEIGYVPQSLAIYNEFTAYENLKFFGQIYNIKGSELQKNIAEALEFTGLTDVKNRKAKTFSGGMLRRLNIACALVHKPRIVIMDEPTVGIDPQSRNHIMDAIRKMNANNVTIVYTSHYMEEIEVLCNNISIIDGGKVIASGTKEELRNLITDKDTLSISVDNLSPINVEDIKKLAGVVDVRIEDMRLEITSQKNSGNLNNILQYILDKDVKASNIGYKAVTLETVFLSLTGKKLRD